MMFIFELLSCAHSQLSPNMSLYLPELCLNSQQQNQNSMTKILGKIASNNSSTISGSSYIMVEKNIDLPFRLRQSNFVLFHHRYSQLIGSIDWGELIGVVNADNNEMSMIVNDKYCIKIGRDQQINSLGMLRPYSLDLLLIFWKQHGQFSLQDLMCCRQRLKIVFEGERQLESFLGQWQSEFILKFGQCFLKENLNRLEFNIITIQDKTILDFVDSLTFECELVKTIANLLGVQLNYEQLQLLLNTITLLDYINFKRQIPQIDQKLSDTVSKIKFSCVGKQIVQTQKSINSNSINSIILDQFFPEQYQPKQGKQQIMEDEDLMIFYFNSLNEDTVDEENTPPKRKLRTVRKRRSKSSDSICIVDEPPLDDQFFDRY